MQTILDYSQDLASKEYHRLTRLHPAPDFVKQASEQQRCGGEAREQLDARVFGDPVKRDYCCKTKAATWVSALYFGEKRSSFEPTRANQIAERILGHARYWCIEPMVKDLWAKMASDRAGEDPNDLPADTVYALVVEQPDGSTARRYPLRNAKEIKVAAAWFAKHRDAFDFPMRQQFASKVLSQAEKRAADIGDELTILSQSAGYGANHSTVVASAWQKRAALVRRTHPDVASQIDAVVSAIEAEPLTVHDQGARYKLAEQLDAFDRRFLEFDKLYAAGSLTRPEEVAFGITEKVARDFAHTYVATATGALFEKAALARLPLEDIQAWLGDQVADEVSGGGIYLDVEKLATTLATLPPGMADRFERLAEAHQIPVVGRAANTGPAPLTPEQLQLLATV